MINTTESVINTFYVSAKNQFKAIMLKPLEVHICGGESVISEIDLLDLVYQTTSGSNFINKFKIA